MSRADKDCAMTEQDAVAADELTRFCQHLVHTSQLKSFRSFSVGSNAEIAYNGPSMEALGVQMENEDADYMLYSNDVCAFPLTQRVPVEFNGVLLRIFTHGLHPGYAILINESSGEVKKYMYVHDRSRLGRYKEIRGPAERFRQSDDIEENLQHLDDEMILINTVDLMPVMETVYAVHSPYWPVEASEWITRTRRHACPPVSVIKQVVRYGCDFVGIAHKLSCNRENVNEWRFSFSIAELIIIRSWTSQQRIVYRVLRLVCKMIAQRAAAKNKATVLCTYYFKTLMLWACEERPEEFWAEHSLVHSMQQLLIEMAEWLTSKFCSNYFIRDNNIMDHLVDADVSRVVADLSETFASRDLIVRMATLCANDESFADTLTLVADLPIWIHRTILVQDRVCNPRDSYRVIGATNSSLELQTAFAQELTDIYRGLACHREAVTRDAVRDKCLRRAEEHFTAATRLHQCTERTIADITRSVFDSIRQFFSAYNANLATRVAESVTEKCALHCVPAYKAAHFNKYATRKCALYKRVLAEQSNNAQKVIAQTTSLVVHLLITQKGVKNVRETYSYRQWPSCSPSVNASWFIAKAYLVNLYYTQRHYKAAIEKCNEVVEIYKHSVGNLCFAELAFPVLLSTQWAAVYDAELQALLGLYSLCAFVSNGPDACAVCLAVCPVQFLLYLKTRCVALDQRYTNNVVQRIADEYDAHIDQCRCALLGSSLAREILSNAMKIK